MAVGDRTTLNQLFYLLRDSLAKNAANSQDRQSIEACEPYYREFRLGDVQHSQADISKAIGILKFNPIIKIEFGLELSAK